MVTKKWILIGILSAAVLQTPVTALAAPKIMSDGTVFDAAYYADNNPDVKAVFGTNEQNLYAHYKMFGKNEGRLPVAPTAYPTPATQQSVTSIMESGFDPVYYANNNKDVVAVLGNNPQQLYLHYTLFGKQEGRRGCAPAAANTNTVSSPSSSQSQSGNTINGLDETQYKRVMQRVDSNNGIAKSLVKEINRYRDEKDKKKVYRDDALEQAATLLAMEMDDAEKASSTRPNGNSYSSVFSQFGINDYEYQGMIYQKNRSSDAEKLVEEWTSDSSDRSELQNKHYKYAGVGRSNKYWVVLFTD